MVPPIGVAVDLLRSKLITFVTESTSSTKHPLLRYLLSDYSLTSKWKVEFVSYEDPKRLVYLYYKDISDLLFYFEIQ